MNTTTNITLNTLCTDSKAVSEAKENITKNWSDINFYERTDNFMFEERDLRHYNDGTTEFDYCYVIRGYENWDCGHDGCEFCYELALVPAWGSLSRENQEAVRRAIGEPDAECYASDIAEYGIEIVIGTIHTLNEWPDLDIVALAATAIAEQERTLKSDIPHDYYRLYDWLKAA
jgi:hypothetical protein